MSTRVGATELTPPEEMEEYVAEQLDQGYSMMRDDDAPVPRDIIVFLTIDRHGPRIGQKLALILIQEFGIKSQALLMTFVTQSIENVVAAFAQHQLMECIIDIVKVYLYGQYVEEHLKEEGVTYESIDYTTVDPEIYDVLRRTKMRRTGEQFQAAIQACYGNGQQDNNSDDSTLSSSESEGSTRKSRSRRSQYRSSASRTEDEIQDNAHTLGFV